MTAVRVGSTASFGATARAVAWLRGPGPQQLCTAVAVAAQQEAEQTAPVATGALRLSHCVTTSDGQSDYQARAAAAHSLRAAHWLPAVAPPPGPGAVLFCADAIGALLEHGSAGGKVPPRPWFTATCEHARAAAGGLGAAGLAGQLRAWEPSTD